MATNVGAMWDRLPILAEAEKKLRQEAGAVCYPARNESGQIELKVCDEERYAAITRELEGIATERTKIEDKLARLKELLGDNGPYCIPIPGSEFDYISRLKADLGNRFFHKIMCERRQWLLPEEAIKTPEYQTLIAEVMPKIEAADARDVEARRLSIAANQILREP